MQPALTPGATVAVTGAAGMLGDSLVPALAARGYRVVASDIDVRRTQPWGPQAPRLHLVDVRSPQDVDEHLRRVAPRVVIHLAAETSLEQCERDPGHAVRTNETGTQIVVEACRRHGAALAYVSTAGVFRGDKGEAYDERDEPDPINWYGRSKAAGEHRVREALADHYIVRAGWMVGRPKGKDHKFIGRIVEQIRAGRTVVHAVGDKYGSPTYAPDFSANLVELLAANAARGIYHAVSETRRSRYEIAAEVVAELDRSDVEVRAVDSTFFAGEFFAPRPHSEVLRNDRLRAAACHHMRPWPQPLAEYLRPWRAELSNQTPSRALQ